MTRSLNHPLLKKELHLLLPAWVLAFLLAVAPPLLYAHQFFGHRYDSFIPFAPVWFGVVLLCASSFGREFSLGTFSGLLALPFPRRQFWLAKAGVLILALITVLGMNVLVGFQDFIIMIDVPTAAWMGVLLLAAMAGGFWLALLVRQTVAVVWLVALVPGLLCLPFLLGLSRFGASDHVVAVTLYALLLVYSVAGIAASWLIFCRAQDAPWSGGAIHLPDWLTANISLSTTAAAAAPRTALQALIRKEFQLNQVPLLGMGVLFLLHLGVVLLRYLHRHPDPADHFWSDLNFFLGAFGAIWIIAPLIIGCTSVAEERKMGTLAGQLCQPVTACRQFLVKLGFTVGVGGLLSALLCLTAEGIDRSLGINGHGMPAEEVLVITVGLSAIALIALYASTLTRNLLQALPAAVGVALGIGLVLQLFYGSSFSNYLITSFVFWNNLLPCFIVVVLLPPTLTWLAYQNFRCLPESGRLWRRNGSTFAALILFSGLAGSAIYHRAWELFTPFEPAAGPARWAPGHQPVVLPTGLGNDLLVALPDGRLWQGRIGDRAQLMQPGPVAQNWSDALNTPLAPRLSAGQFLPGSNWVSLSIGLVDINRRPNTPAGSPPEYLVSGHDYYRGMETLGVRADGTLWVSALPMPGDVPFVIMNQCNTNVLVPCGPETNWREVAADPASGTALLLKTDGTLWRWGGPRPGAAGLPGLRSTPPRQIGANTDWQALTHDVRGGAIKADGTIWSIRFHAKTGADEIKPIANYEQLARRHDRQSAGNNAEAIGPMNRSEIHPDGTLWFEWMPGSPHSPPPPAVQLGHDHNWRAVGIGLFVVVALKQDGTLWQWGDESRFTGMSQDFIKTSHRLGTRQDWVALAQTQEGVVSLAADGSLCLWPLNQDWTGGANRLIAPSRKPVPLGNLLAASQSQQP
jgi:ABC-type transport system involved in multi-copper enzyme maturation permease subunit